MNRKWIAVFFCIVATSYAASINEVDSGRSSDDTLSLVSRLWDSCNNNADLGVISCLKMKIATAVERAARMNDLTVFEGVTFVRHAPAEDTPTEDEDTIKASLPRSADARDETLNAMILERALHFFQTHSLSVKLAENAEFERSLSAGDGTY